ncbi:MAG: hypothetical protein IT439_01390 [Phycisphaerales bacterium]|nr:hypothetical protein [Phycisphaerales bacterium]
MPLPPDILALERSVQGTITFAPADPYPDGAELRYLNALGPRALVWALRTLKKHLRLLPADHLDDFITFFKKYDGATLYAVLDEAQRLRAALTLARINQWKSIRRLPGLDQLALPGTDPGDWLVIGGVGSPARLLVVYRGQPASTARAGAIHTIALQPSPSLNPQPVFAALGDMLAELAREPADALTMLGYSLDPAGECTPVAVQPSSEPVQITPSGRARR